MSIKRLFWAVVLSFLIYLAPFPAPQVGLIPLGAVLDMLFEFSPASVALLFMIQVGFGVTLYFQFEKSALRTVLTVLGFFVLACLAAYFSFYFHAFF